MRIVSALLAAILVCGGFAAAAGEASAAEPPSTRLALAIPLTVPPEVTGLIPADILETYTSPSGILTHQLSSVIDREVAIGLDPMIVASIRILGNTAPRSAIDWLQRLRNADNEIFSLSYADSDIAALSQAGSTTILEPQYFPIDASLFPLEPEDSQDSGPSATPGAEQTPPPAELAVPTSETLTDWRYTIDNVLWPRRNTVTTADLTGFNAEETVTTILSSANVAAAAGASGSVDGNPVLISDDVISQLISRAATSPTVVQWRSVMDQLAEALGQRSDATGAVLATIERAAPATANRLDETVAALAELPNVELTELSTVMAERPSAVRLVEQPVNPARVSRFRLLLAAEARITQFSSIVDEPAPLTGERRLTLVALASNSWVNPSQRWGAAVDAWLERSTTILNSVQIAEGSTINFFQDKGSLPITVSNSLDYPVTVYLTVRSETGILVVLDSRVAHEVEANSQSRAFIPVQSVANGTVSLQVSLSSETGVAIGAPKTVTTNVAAGWETTATFIIAALLLLVFIAGIVRTVLKRRRMLGAADEQDRTDDEGSGG